MSLLRAIGKFVGLGYDAARENQRRKAPASKLRSEDRELNSSDRGRLITNARDMRRNFAIAKWMIARHLDYVTTFSFQAKTGDDALDTQLEASIGEFGKKEAFDVAGRHSLARAIRFAEARRVIDGDLGLLRLADGRLQAIESDRIRTPLGMPGDWMPTVDSAGRVLRQWIEGVEVDGSGRALNYAICRRLPLTGGFILDRIVPAAHLYLHAAYGERFDCVRGISEIASALNSFRDTYEGFDYALAKMKVSQLFGLKIFRESSEPLGQITQTASDAGEDGEQKDVGYTIDFGRGPFLLDLDPGDQADFLEAQSPSLEFQQFASTIIAAALKALNIPYSFYSEDFTNYSGARQAYLQYEQSAEIVRQDVRELLDWWTAWRLSLAVQDGKLPIAALDARWEWIHRGMPWLDPLKEIQAELFAIDSSLDNYEDVAQRHGRNVYENIDKNARVRAYAEEAGVPLSTMKTIWIPVGNNDAGQQQVA
jgi:capsid protein